MFDYKQDEQNIKKIIDKEMSGKQKLVLDPNNYIPQLQILTQDCMQQCEKSSSQKGYKEMIEFRANVSSHEKVIDAIRAANFVEIQNVQNRFKRLLKEILEQIADQLGNLFKQEFLKLWLEWRSAKMALQEKDLKLKVSEASQQSQEQELIAIRTQFSAQNTFLSLNKKLEDNIANLEGENSKLKENIQNLTKQHNDLKLAFEELSNKFKKLQQQFNEQKESYEKEISQLKTQEGNLIQANKDLIELTNQLSSQVERFRDLYETQNQKNIDLTDQLKYWKSTHQQRLVDLQHSEQRIGSQKGYLFKYRREVQDLRRFKVYSEEASKELSNARQTVNFLNQQTEQLKQNFENTIVQNLNINIEKNENLNQILLRNATSTKKANTETNVFYESPKKGKFDFSSIKKVAAQNQPSSDELSQFLISYTKAPIQRPKIRSVSAKKTHTQENSDNSKTNINLQELDQLTPFTDQTVRQFQFTQFSKQQSTKSKIIKRQNTEG